MFLPIGLFSLNFRGYIYLRRHIQGFFNKENHKRFFYKKKHNIYSKPYNTVQQLNTLFQLVFSKQTLDMIRQLTIKDKIKQTFRFCFIDTYHT